MGDPKRQKKKYDTPKYAWSAKRLQSELRLLGEYGLRNKRELWRHYAMLSKNRMLARGLLTKPLTERTLLEKQLLGKLNSLGIVSPNATLDDILEMSIEDILERRLQTVVLRHELAKTPIQARQFIVHGHISIKGRRVNVPGYLVRRSEEQLMTYTATSPIANVDHPLRKALSGSTLTVDEKPVLEGDKSGSTLTVDEKPVLEGDN